MIEMFKDEVINEQKKECSCRYCEEYAAGNCQNQYNRKLDGAEEEVSYCTDSACADYLDTCEEKEDYDYIGKRILNIIDYIGKRILNIIELQLIFMTMHYDRNVPNSPDRQQIRFHYCNRDNLIWCNYSNA